jgi:putative NADH-flavin reductase
MRQIKKVAVIGGTGKSGKYLVKQLIDQGYHLKVLVRNPENFKVNGPLIEVVKGDVKDYDTIRSLIIGCNAVISTLGLGIPQSEPSIFTKATAHVLRAMSQFNINRYIVTTGLNVDTPFDEKTGKTAFATSWMKTNYPQSTMNKQEEYMMLSGSNVDWTLVRLPLIEQTDFSGKVNISLNDCPGDKISATSLANFLIKQLSDKKYFNQAPFAAND